MIKYRTYMKKIPKKFRKLKGSAFVRPVGGLWGCRGDEWKEAYDRGLIIQAEDYDAVEVHAKALQELKEGWDIEDLALSSSRLNHNPWLMLLASYGLVGWDVPSICAFKPDKVEFIREIEG